MIATLREKLKAMVTAHESPHDIALAFAVGIFIAFSPLIGLHTAMAAGVVWGFRMNPIAVFAGAFVNNPWTFVPIFGPCLWVGMMLWQPDAGLPPISLEGVTLATFFTQFKPYLMPFVVGSTVVSVVASIASYVVMKGLIATYRKQRQSRLSGSGDSDDSGN